MHLQKKEEAFDPTNKNNFYNKYTDKYYIKSYDSTKLVQVL